MVKYLTWVKKKKQIKKPKSLMYSVNDIIGNVLWDRERDKVHFFSPYRWQALQLLQLPECTLSSTFVSSIFQIPHENLF